MKHSFKRSNSSSLIKNCFPVTKLCIPCPQSYTQYIPLSVYDLQMWMGSPSIYVYDCSNAGIILESFKQFSQQREQELEVSSENHVASSPPSFKSVPRVIQGHDNSIWNCGETRISLP